MGRRWPGHHAPAGIIDPRCGADGEHRNAVTGTGTGGVRRALGAKAATNDGDDALRDRGRPEGPTAVDVYRSLLSFSTRGEQQLRPYVVSGRLQLAIVPVSVLDYEDQGRSTPAAQVMASLPADHMVAAWTGGSWAVRRRQTAPPSCSSTMWPRMRSR